MFPFQPVVLDGNAHNRGVLSKEFRRLFLRNWWVKCPWKGLRSKDRRYPRFKPKLLSIGKILNPVGYQLGCWLLMRADDQSEVLPGKIEPKGHAL